MSYSYDKFLRPITSSDRNIKILDDVNDIKYTIDPFVIRNVTISNNILEINLKSQRTISLHFSTINEAKLALTRIQIQIDTLIKNTPLLIDRDVKNYVDEIEQSIQTQLNDKVSSQWITTGSNIYYNSGLIGIGLTAPSTKLHIYSTQSGIFRLDDGTQIDRYILTSNSQGIGSWNSVTYSIGYEPVNKAGDIILGTLTASNLSGINTGDETNSTIKNKLGTASSINDGYLGSDTYGRLVQVVDEVYYDGLGNLLDFTTFWGGITGSISSQTDLFDILNSKQNTLTNPVTGTGSSNQLAYFNGTSSLLSLDTNTYPNLTELSYVKNITSSIQTQINSKQNTLTNPVTGTGSSNQLAYFNGTSSLLSLDINTYPSLTELSYVKGVTSSIQTQINSKQNTLTNPVTGTGSINQITYFSGTSSISSLDTNTYPNLTELSYVKGITSSIQTQINAVNINNIIISTTASITTNTNDSSGYGQNGRNVMISNGANAINLTCEITSTSNFVSSYTKLGTSTITFVAGSGATLVQVDGTALLNGVVGSTACLTRTGNTFYLQISNR